MKGIFSDRRKAFIFFLLLSLLFYINSLKNDFSFDDSYVTVTNYPARGQKYVPNNPLIAEGFSGIPKIWRSRYGHGAGTAYDYRPVVNTLFAIEYAIFGQSPHVCHFISILLYTVTVFLIFLLLRRCLKKFPFGDAFALVCSVLFLAHPLHSEVVDNIKCTDELLALIFGLLASWQVLNYFERKRAVHIFYGAIFLLLGTFSKMNAIVFAVLIPLILYFFTEVKKKHLLFVLCGLVPIFWIYVRVRNLLVTEAEKRFLFHFENPLYTEKVSFFTKLLFAVKTVGIYIKLLLFPFPLRYYYGTAMVTTDLSLFDFDIILCLLFTLGAAYYCYRSRNKIAIFGLLFFYMALAPFSNMLQPVAGIVAERLLFTASLGFFVFVTAILISFLKNYSFKNPLQIFTQKPVGYLSGILLIFLFYTWNRNSNWKNEITLFEHDSVYLEKSAGANNLLANKYAEYLSNPDMGQMQSALISKCLKYYRLAYETDSSLYSALNNAGVIVFRYLNQPAQALTYFQRAVRINPMFAQAHENLGDCYSVLGNKTGARQQYIQAIAQNSSQLQSYRKLAQLFFDEKRYNKCLVILKLAARYFPESYFVNQTTGLCLFRTGRLRDAAAPLEKAYVLNPNKELAHQLGIIYTSLDDSVKSQEYTKLAETLP
jgi:tetratricopeptide (TPR) repeat protein